MDSISEQLIIGADFKVAVERRSLEMVETSLVAPKGALQCTCREEVESDADKYYKNINQRDLFINAINEIEKYEWDISAKGSVYRINVPGHDVTYYYPDIAKQETHIIKFYVVCYFTIGMSEVASKAIPPDRIGTASAAATHDESGAAARSQSPLTEERHFSHPFSHRLLPKQIKPGRASEQVLGYSILAIFASILLILPVQLVKVLRPSPAVVALATETPPPAPVPAPVPPPPAPPPLPPPVVAPPAAAPSAVVAPVIPAAAKPDASPQLPVAPTKPAVPAGADSRDQHLQEALTKLGFYHGPITGVFGPKTAQALSDFSHAVPLAIRQKFGQNTLAMAQSALRGEFALTGHGDEPKAR